MQTTASEAGAPAAEAARTVTVRSNRGAMRAYDGQTGTVESESAMGVTVRFADGNTKTVRPSEVTA